jgi:lipoprotein-anchoring transpeptidase ErfK/SrfK
MNKLCRFATVAAVVVAATAFATEASANPFAWLGLGYTPTDNGNEVRADLRRVTVDYPTNEAPGTVVVDTANTYLYYVLAGGKAIRYGIGVGREGFTWSGVKTVERKAEWPDWTPPPEMIARQPYLPRFMAGGPGNPLGARAMYLGGTVYRIHGTNDPSTIGGHVSSGCIRLTNDDVTDLYSRVNLGTKVIVLPMEHHANGAGGANG